MSQTARIVLALARRAPAQAASLSPMLSALTVQSSSVQVAVQQALAPALVKSISTSSFAASGLVNALDKELKLEKKEYEKPDVIAKGPPAPFTLDQTPGDMTLSLKREYKGEEIVVEVLGEEVRAGRALASH